MEQFFKDCIIGHLETNNCIIRNHHGSIKGHSTLTALASINHHLTRNYYSNKYTGLIQTDLSAAFDTIDTNTLMEKFEHYGVCNKELNIMKSFLKNRKQYVSIDSMESEILSSPQCSCIQGSRMSSLLYMIYTNEIPLLSKLMFSQTLTDLTGLAKYDNKADINSYTIQYVDDSTNMISTKNINLLQKFINNFFLLLESV